MQSSKEKEILKKYRYVFETLENYDKTRELPFQRKKIYLTLSVETLKKLQKMRTETGKPISRIVEEKI
jgi:hypothetical protein